ncbi:hypothetical protein [Bergeyella sp. RCAD1439]|uniref:hypothetical protein n=1 Tax=Bergeyella anatis TaxID=3113737 RepID=UPI002E19AF6E|nr:hypothetical protein [Bergeyella sp. RCAD1439]
MAHFIHIKGLLKLLVTENKKTSCNIGFAKEGVKFPCVELFAIFSRKKPFSFTNFCILAKEKWFLLSFVFIESFVFLIPAFAKPFSDNGDRIEIKRCSDWVEIDCPDDQEAAAPMV